MNEKRKINEITQQEIIDCCAIIGRQASYFFDHPEDLFKYWEKQLEEKLNKLNIEHPFVENRNYYKAN